MVALPVSPHRVSHHLFGGRYRLLEEVGSGSFSRVFRAEDTADGNQLVAIKQLRQHGLSATMRGTGRLAYRREAAVLSRLHHHRIPRLRDSAIGGSGGFWYLVLDYVVGETLERYLQRQYSLLPVPEVLEIGIQLSEVLGYLHSYRPPLKFRDLKPANIMRKPSGEIMLIDFGLACPAADQTNPLSLGSLGYAAPEQYATLYGEGVSTLQSDIYSLGVILHQLLSGEYPANKPLAVMFDFSSLAGTTSPALAALVAQMLRPEPEQRGTIQEVKYWLEEVQVALFRYCQRYQGSKAQGF